jgi:hypothetical protein
MLFGKMSKAILDFEGEQHLLSSNSKDHHTRSLSFL